MVVAAIGVLAIVWGTFLGGSDLAQGDKNILALAVDESEKRPGMGAVDMAFVVEMKDGSIANYTPVYAKEIVEANTNLTPDAVVVVNTEGLDAVISAAGPIKVDGKIANISAVDLVRENDQLHGGAMTRGQAVMALASALSTAANNPTTHNAMIQDVLDQYSKGNIAIVPQGSFVSLMASKGLGSVLG